MLHSVGNNRTSIRAVVTPPMILKPSAMRRILMQVLGRNPMMLTDDHTA
jgi:ABC-type molybdate transport system permease subunit